MSPISTTSHHHSRRPRSRHSTRGVAKPRSCDWRAWPPISATALINRLLARGHPVPYIAGCARAARPGPAGAPLASMCEVTRHRAHHPAFRSRLRIRRALGHRLRSPGRHPGFGRPGRDRHVLGTGGRQSLGNRQSRWGCAHQLLVSLGYRGGAGRLREGGRADRNYRAGPWRCCPPLLASSR
jgi:hypothetical protein